MTAADVPADQCVPPALTRSARLPYLVWLAQRNTARRAGEVQRACRGCGALYYPYELDEHADIFPGDTVSVDGVEVIVESQQHALVLTGRA